MLEETRKENLLLGVAVIALCVEILFLLAQLRLVRLPGFSGAQWSERPALGAVRFRKSSLRGRAPDSLTWYPLTEGDPVHLNDTLMTGPNAAARITLNEGEGSEISLEGDTLIRFSVEGDKSNSGVLRLEVNQGKIRVKSESKKVRLRLKGREIALSPKSEVVVEKLIEAKEPELQVVSGKVDIETPEKTQSVLEGEVIRFAPSLETPLEKTKAVLEIENREPTEGLRLFAEGVSQNVTFSWDGKSGDVLEWDTASDFSTLKAIASDGKIDIPLGSGNFFWRIRREPLKTEARKLTVVPKANYVLTEPVEGEKVKRSEKVELRWEPLEKDAVYVVQIASQAEFSAIYREEKVRAPSVVLGKLPPGKYFWRVKAIESSWGERPFSKPNSFFIRPPLKAPKTKGAKILPDKQSSILDLFIASAYADSTALWEFNWETIIGAKGYRLEIARDKRFKKIVEKKDFEAPPALVELPREDIYYWRVAGYDMEGEMGSFSEVQSVTSPKVVVPAPPPPPPIVKSEPQPEPKPIIEAKPKPAPKPATPSVFTEKGWGSFVPIWLRASASSSFRFQQISTSSETVRTSGLPIGRVGGSLHWGRLPSDIEVMGFYHTLRYSPLDGLPADIQPALSGSEYGASFLWKGPFTFGAGFERVHDISRTSPESVALSNQSIGFVRAGISFSSLQAEMFSMNEVLLEISPLGLLGGGLWVRSRLGLWKISPPLTLEAELLVHPSYRYIPSLSKAHLTLEVVGSIVMGGLF